MNANNLQLPLDEKSVVAADHVLVVLVPPEYWTKAEECPKERLDFVRLGWKVTLSGITSDTFMPTGIMYTLYPPPEAQAKYRFSDKDWIEHFIHHLHIRSVSLRFKVVHPS